MRAMIAADDGVLTSRPWHCALWRSVRAWDGPARSQRQCELLLEVARGDFGEQVLRRRIPKPHAQLAFHPRIGQPPRFAHERQQERSDALLGLLPRYPRRTRELERIGHGI